MATKKNFPYQILDLADLEGELWEDVPGFDGAYLVSNFGRIKSLRRWRNAGKGGGYYTEEKILRLRTSTKPNHHLKTKTYNVGVSLKMDGKVRSTSVAKYVYYAFVAPFDLDDPELVVSFIDCEGRNLRPENLILTTRSKLLKRAYDLKRAEVDFKLPVLQLDMEGNIVARFESITEAGEKKGWSIGAIAECTKGHIFQHKGYRWQLENKVKKIRQPKKAKDEVFNEYLWEKIGKPRTSLKTPIPVLNLNPESMEGEIWKPIEGLNNTYQVSNRGRIKSCSRFKGNQVWLKEHISKLVADGNKNKPTSTLLATLSKDGKKFQQSVARLVYFHFVAPFDISDKSKRVSFKDGCFYNLVPENLVLNVKQELSIK
ncbi:NUMOD4 domain-containing protein [Chitinophagaceae bacterium LB-8]|uniref:NUMOD4 domain-containing protein n=1 Tax=Paraflavisolibacter caeni TaxID=2982496 RepID=A0A9X2XX80_9BACT|nr:NUMOD4 domain-containing protein [Paraflavisolibacter caeni]MCU7550411.1 NUMOD4 domain-containing protein [Paraflavisolibacter caeni]